MSLKKARASASTFSTNDFIFMTHLNYCFNLYCDLHEVFLCLKSCLFEMAKLIKHVLNSLSGAGCLVLKKKYNLNLTNIKCSNHVSKLTS